MPDDWNSRVRYDAIHTTSLPSLPVIFLAIEMYTYSTLGYYTQKDSTSKTPSAGGRTSPVCFLVDIPDPPQEAGMMGVWCLTGVVVIAVARVGMLLKDVSKS